MLDFIEFFENYYEVKPSDRLLKLKEHSEEITGKPYYILVTEKRGSQFSASVSTDSEKHTIELPKITLQDVDHAEVTEILIAHEVIHPLLETKGFIKYPFNETWKDLVYHIILDLIINRVELPKHSFSYTKCVYQFNLKNIEISKKHGFVVPMMIGNAYIDTLLIIGNLLTCRWFWYKGHRKVKEILRVLKKYIATGSAFGDIYETMSKELNKIDDLCSYSATYEKAKYLTNEIETIFESKGISFTEIRR